jgi:uncharacterized protein (UPF0332 family)
LLLFYGSVVTYKRSVCENTSGCAKKISELFIKTSIFPDFIANYIKTSFDLRQEADYDFDADIPIEIAKSIVTNIKEFYHHAIAYLQDLIESQDENQL